MSISIKPAALMVSPLSTKSTIASATPNAQEASTEPPTNLILVFNGSPDLTPSNFSKYFLVKVVNDETIVLPINCFGSLIGPSCGTWTCNLHLPNVKSNANSTSTSDSSTWSTPVIPNEQRPSPTKVGISAAGKKIKAIGKFVDKAISNLL